MASTPFTTRGTPHMQQASPTAITNLHVPTFGERLGKIDYNAALVRFVAFNNAPILLCLIWMLFTPDGSMGVLRFLQEDTGAPRTVIIGIFAFLFFMDISQTMKELRQIKQGRQLGWSFITCLSAQFVLAFFTIIYAVKGDVSWIALYTNVGPLFLSLIGLIAILQRQKVPFPYTLPRGLSFNAKERMLTSVSLCMGVLGIGLITRPDVAITRFIQDERGFGFFVIMVGLIAWGAGQLRHNHMLPWSAIRRMTGMALFCLMTATLFTTNDAAISLLTVYLSFAVMMLSFMFAFIHAQERIDEQSKAG